MNEDQRFSDIMTLARMAARLAGRDPDEHISVRIWNLLAFNDVAWRFPDFMSRAEAAYNMLHNGVGF